MFSKANGWKLWLLIAVLLAISACASQNNETLADLPTLAVLPSLTPSNTFTPTNAATNTPTPTSTNTPTITPTFTPSQAPTPTVSVTSSITATFTLTYTPTRTATSTPSQTPLASATPNTPQIVSFTSSTSTVSANNVITLQWVTISDSTRIDLLNQQGGVVQTFATVTPSGQISVTVPGNLGRQVIYRLVAMRSGQEASQSVPIIINCTIAWFFGDATGVTGCPSAVGSISGGAFQNFERGLMIYVTANGMNKIYGLQTSDNRYIAYQNGWDNSALSYDNAPSGFFQPKEEFRWAFINTLAPVGTWQNSIGWGTSDINRDLRTIQFEESTGAFYIDSPLGIYRFSGGDNGTWTKVK
jgi:hypothetical protein